MASSWVSIRCAYPVEAQIAGARLANVMNPN